MLSVGIVAAMFSPLRIMCLCGVVFSAFRRRSSCHFACYLLVFTCPVFLSVSLVCRYPVLPLYFIATQPYLLSVSPFVLGASVYSLVSRVSFF